jgi:glycogen synthase
MSKKEIVIKSRNTSLNEKFEQIKIHQCFTNNLAAFTYIVNAIHDKHFKWTQSKGDRKVYDEKESMKNKIMRKEEEENLKKEIEEDLTGL